MIRFPGPKSAVFLLFFLLGSGALACQNAYREIRAYREANPTRTSERWPMDAEANFSYDRAFQPHLGQTFPAWIAERKAAGKTAHVADFFGSGVFLKDPSVADSITGMRLLPLVVPGMVKGYPAPNWREVTGDLFKRETWDMVDATMKEREIPKFDLIVAIPIGPILITEKKFDTQTKRTGYLAVHLGMLRRAYQRLSDQDGVMLFEVPHLVAETKEFQAWMTEVKRQGFDAEYRPDNVTIPGFVPKTPDDKAVSSGAVRLRRTPASPAQLP